MIKRFAKKNLFLYSLLVFVLCACKENPKHQKPDFILEDFKCPKLKFNFNWSDLELNEEQKEEIKYKKSYYKTKIKRKKNSIAVKVKGNNCLLNKKRFKLYPIQSEEEFEFAKKIIDYSEACFKDSLLSIKHRIVKLKFNDTLAYCLFKETPRKRFLEANRRRNGIILKKLDAPEVYYQSKKEKNLKANFSLDWELEKALRINKKLQQFQLDQVKTKALAYQNPITGHHELFYDVKFPQEPGELYKVSKTSSSTSFQHRLFKQKGDTLEFVRDSVNGFEVSLKQTIKIPSGYVVHFPKGSNILILNNGTIISYSPIVCSGTEKEPVTFWTEKSTGMGVHVFYANGKSKFNHCKFLAQSALNKQYTFSNSMVTIYESEAVFNNCKFVRSFTEDALNCFRSKVKINQCEFINTQSDALDLDFSVAEITNSKFSKCMNDGIDASGSIININNVELSEIQDKGISAGENSTITAENLSINKAEIALTSKDLSKLVVSKSKLSDCSLMYCAFQKKPEYGPATIVISDSKVFNFNEEQLIQEKSSITIDGKKTKGVIKDVKKYLYGKEYGRATKK